MKPSTTNKWINLILYISGIILIFLIWSIISITKNNILYPSIFEIIKDLAQMLIDVNNLLIILYTLIKLVLIIISSYLISVFLGILAYKYRIVYKLLSPIMAIMRSLPVASLIIILILLIGLKYSPLFITLFVIMPIGYENIYTNLKNIDNDILDEIRLNSNINLKIIFTLLFPMKMDSIISVVLQTIGLGLKILVMSEILTQGDNTIGGKIQLAKSYLDITRVFSWTFLLLIIVMIFELLVNKLRSKIDKI